MNFEYKLFEDKIKNVFDTAENCYRQECNQSQLVGLTVILLDETYSLPKLYLSWEEVQFRVWIVSPHIATAKNMR